MITTIYTRPSSWTFNVLRPLLFNKISVEENALKEENF